ncbi:cytochrome P450 [Stachybotrys elegans]|uniref:Cytochrome P450 n=1 Tax=Stachybotrys elegans TaxID=80388 RepID=A0A8K0WQG6_9HYPO|nr:cytochrome P450 [Stachybotrys elegans]
MALYVLVISVLLATVAIIWRMRYPKLYPGIPYNLESARRFTGDIPELASAIGATGEICVSLFQVTTQKLGTPVAQLLSPGARKPLIMVDDPREVEDIILRRGKEFDKAALSVQMFSPMFPHAILSSFTTPELKAQKRLWADIMSVDFHRRAVAPIVHKAIMQLLDLWRLKASTTYRDEAFEASDDCHNVALDVIWGTITGDALGMVEYNIRKQQNQVAGESLPRGAFIKKETAYLAETFGGNAGSPFSAILHAIHKMTPRYRAFKALVDGEIETIWRNALERFKRLDSRNLESGEYDICMTDFVLRRQHLEAAKTGNPVPDPVKDPVMRDEILAHMIAGYDSSANNMSWFVKFMEMFPAAQAELRAALRKAFPGPELPSIDAVLETSVPYLDATCEETFRFAHASGGNYRQAMVDTEILGYKIPKGATLFLSFQTMSPEFPIDENKRAPTCRAALEKSGDRMQGGAGRNLDTFNPRRWLDFNKSGDETFNPYALPMNGFGGGYRGCPGRKLAHVELRVFMVYTILAFEFLEVSENLKSTKAKEVLFREPAMSYVRLKSL